MRRWLSGLSERQLRREIKKATKFAVYCEQNGHLTNAQIEWDRVRDLSRELDRRSGRIWVETPEREPGVAWASAPDPDHPESEENEAARYGY